MLAETFSEGLCIPPMGPDDPNGVIHKDEISEQQVNHSMATVADVICLPSNQEPRDVIPHEVWGKRKLSSEHKGRVRWTSSDTLVLVNAKLVEKNMHSAGGAIKRTKSAIEKYLNHHAMNVQRMINVEEQKVKAQRDLVSALNTIGQAMLKICESLDTKG